MSDLTPNDLSHMSDAEFHTLCPQGEHAPGPEPLSPAAQAVDRAIADRIQLLGEMAPSRQVAAAALRALTTRAEITEIHPAPVMPEFDEVIRVSDILSIAAELDPTTETK